MKFILVVICLTVSKTLSAPAPQNDFDPDSLDLQNFDEENISQQGRLTPQGFTQPQENPIRARQTQPIVPNGAAVIRYFYDLEEDRYKFT